MEYKSLCDQIVELQSKLHKTELQIRALADAAYEVTCYPNDEAKRYALMALVQKEFTERGASEKRIDVPMPPPLTVDNVLSGLEKHPQTCTCDRCWKASLDSAGSTD